MCASIATPPFGITEYEHRLHAGDCAVKIAAMASRRVATRL
jgi:hypothetical protein